MKLSKTHKYIVLCEDKQSLCYIRRFLLTQGIDGRKIFMLALPASGCGEQYVRIQFPKYLKLLRSRNFDSNVFVVAIDADKKTYSERKMQLENTCQSANMPLVQKTDKLLLFIPKRNIETWIKYYRNESVDEEQDYAHFLNGHESDCYTAADKMSNDFSLGTVSDVLPSLQESYRNYEHLVTLLEA